MRLDKVLGRWIKKLPRAIAANDDSRADKSPASDPGLLVDQFRRISQSNVEAAVSFMEHRYQWSKRDLGENFSVDGGLERVIMDPGSGNLAGFVDNPNEIYDIEGEISERMNDGDSRVEEYIQSVEKKTQEEDRNIEILRRKYEESVRGKCENFHFMDDIGEGGVFESKLLAAGIRCALILTDTFYTRDTDFYKNLILIFRKNEIPYVEFTNIQPNLDRKLIFRIHEFASDHDVNSVVAVGSMSTVDISKILLPKLMKPNIIRLHRTREFDLAIASNYSIFSIPTYVVPDPKVNSRSAVRNNLFLPDNDFFGNVMYLKNEIDDSDGVFYCTDVFNFLEKEKIMEALHETFFRLVFSYFDLSASDELLAEIIRNIKEILRLMEVVTLTEQFEKGDRYEFMRIVSFTMDGRLMVDSWDF